MTELRQFNQYPFTHSELIVVLHQYKSPADKISLLLKNGDILRLKRGLYINSAKFREGDISLNLIANVLYGPSYVSLETALSEYGLIPERVFSTRSVTLKRSRSFENTTGRFEYFQSQSDYYSVGIKIKTLPGGGSFLMATPEKALCDKIVFSKNSSIQSLKEFQIYLEEELRLEVIALKSFNIKIVQQCIEAGKKKTILQYLEKTIKKAK